MGRPLPRTIFTSYAVAWLYLVGFIAGLSEIETYLRPGDR